MACKCIDRQKWLVSILCKRGITRLCQKARDRLAKMEAQNQ